MIGALLLRGCLCAPSALVSAADDLHTRTHPATQPHHDVLLIDSLGRLVRVPASEVPQSLRPSSEIGLRHQLPSATPGTNAPAEVLHRAADAHAFSAEVSLLPSAQPVLMPYLASVAEFGNTAIQPGGLVPMIPFEPMVQGVKYALSEVGLRYTLQQSFTYASMSNVMQRDSTLGFYTLDLQAKWAIFNSPHGAGWISAHLNVQDGLGTEGGSQTAQSNLGSITNPTGVLLSTNEVSISELAWQQSFADGKLLLVAGMVNQSDYFDASAYANSGRGQFLNSALINSMVNPLPGYNFGFNVQVQPDEHWYVMAGASVGNARPGVPPWDNFEWDDWTALSEFGYAPRDFCGLGPGVYRLQPFVSSNGGKVQPGIGLNFQQQLGHGSPLGWFGRFGVAGDAVAAGASAQIGTGIVLLAPLKQLGIAPQLSNDLLGAGFVWSRPAESDQPVFHQDEYVFEMFYTLQLSPTTKLQPDLQVVWDPAFNPDSGPSVVFQFQFVAAW